MNWKIIKSDKEYQKDLSRLEEIFDVRKGHKDFDEASLLVLLIERYEFETEPQFRDLDPVEVIKYKMSLNNMKNKDLDRIIGSKVRRLKFYTVKED